jgi:hypothetical protein
MRSMFRSVLLALTGVLVLGAIASASASAALPEFQHGGKTLEKAVKLSANSGWGSIESTGGVSLKCEGESLAGETHGAKEVANVVIKFFGCGWTVLGQHTICTSPGAKVGEVVTAQLLGRLGYLSKESKWVGLLLQPSKGEQIAECDYGHEKKFLA